MVANRRGIDARGPKITSNQGYGTTPATGYGTHGTTASLTRFTLPSDSEIRETYTPQVFAQNGWGDADTDVKHASGSRNVPRRCRSPGGSATRRRSSTSSCWSRRTGPTTRSTATCPRATATRRLAQFGQQVTPNQHALARQFGLYDNTYDVGTNSAEGHNWLMQGDNPEYTESSAGEYTRSYDTEEDVLGHQRSGFLWTAVQAAGNTARNYGEFEYTEGKPVGRPGSSTTARPRASRAAATPPSSPPRS